MDLEIVLDPRPGQRDLPAGVRTARRSSSIRRATRGGSSAVADARGWRITHVVETHVHNDYLSGALELRAGRRAEIVAPARGRYAFAHRPWTTATRSRSAASGSWRGRPPATRRSTWRGRSRRTDADGPSAVATGGSLLVGSAGRTDLLGADRDRRADPRAVPLAAGARARCRTTWRCCRPTARAASARPARPTAIGPRPSARERRIEPAARGRPDEAAFRAALLGRARAYPTYYAEMAPINRAGPPVAGPAARRPGQLDAGAVRGGGRRGRARRRRPAARRVRGRPHRRDRTNIELTE